MDSLNLIEQARVAGLEIRRDGERLVIRGPKEAEEAANLVLANKDAVIEISVSSAVSSLTGPESGGARSTGAPCICLVTADDIRTATPIPVGCNESGPPQILSRTGQGTEPPDAPAAARRRAPRVYRSPGRRY